jgi:hypothetical protein
MIDPDEWAAWFWLIVCFIATLALVSFAMTALILGV